MDLPIIYGICKCNVWPIVLGYKVYRCGRCREFPKSVGHGSRNLALTAFRVRYGHDPYPFEEECTKRKAS